VSGWLCGALPKMSVALTGTFFVTRERQNSKFFGELGTYVMLALLLTRELPSTRVDTRNLGPG
jgi:hypothetical protein